MDPKTFEKPKGRRTRMSDEQKAVLEAEYLKDPEWTTPRITQIARRLQLNRTKIYKWHWDRK